MTIALYAPHQPHKSWTSPTHSKTEDIQTKSHIKYKTILLREDAVQSDPKVFSYLFARAVNAKLEDCRKALESKI